MDITQIILLADNWGMHDGDIGVGWLVVMVPLMLLMMGGMMRMRMDGGSSSDSSASERPGSTESPMEILERRFAEGEISIDEYRARREALVNGTAEANTNGEDDQRRGRAVDSAGAGDRGP